MTAATRLNAFTVTEYNNAEDGKPAKAWTRIGAAFPNKNGPGYSVRLSALPVNGTLVLLPSDNDEESDTSPTPPLAAARNTRRR